MYICNMEEGKTNLYKEFGSYFLDISKLVFAGVIIAGIMELDINKIALFIFGGAIVTSTAIADFIFIKLSNTQK